MIKNPRGIVTGTYPGPFSSSDPEQLRQQIADTRAGLTDTIDAIQDRVRPRNLMQRAKDSVRETTVERMKNLAETAGDRAGHLYARTAKTRARVVRITRENPVPATVVSLAAVWLLIRSIRNSRRRSSYLYEEPAF
jgi:hypothetical protein